MRKQIVASAVAALALGSTISSAQIADAAVITKAPTISRGAVIKTGKAPSVNRPANAEPRQCPPMGNTRLWKKFYSDTADLGKTGDRMGQIMEVQRHVNNPSMLRIVMDVPEDRDLNGWKSGWYNSMKTTVTVYTPAGKLIKKDIMWHKDRTDCHVYPITGVSLRTTGGFKIATSTEWIRYYLPTSLPWSKEITNTLSTWYPAPRTPVRR